LYDTTTCQRFAPSGCVSVFTSNVSFVASPGFSTSAPSVWRKQPHPASTFVTVTVPAVAFVRSKA
jgi:hypothetical protein